MTIKKVPKRANGGNKTLERYGKNHFKKLAKLRHKVKVSKDSL